MAVVRPPISGVQDLDSWRNQITQHINTNQGFGKGRPRDAGGTGAGSVGPPGPAGAPAPHYAEVTLFTDPLAGATPAAPTATITWSTGALSSITSGWSQTAPTVDPTLPESLYSSKLIFSDSVAPFVTTTTTGSTPIKSFDWTQFDAIGTNIVFVNSVADLPAPSNSIITLKSGVAYVFATHVDLNGARLKTNGISCILGTSVETASITSTGLSASTPLIQSSNNLPMQSITIKDVGTGFLIDAPLSTNGTADIEWFNVNFENVTAVGTMKTVDTFLYDSGTFNNSQGLQFTGNVRDVRLTNCRFEGDGSNASLITVTSTAVIGNEFAISDSTIVASGLSTGVTFFSSAIIPNQGFVLSSSDFLGDSTHIAGITYLDARSRWFNCRGIMNGAVTSSYYMKNNTTASALMVTSTPTKIAGATISAPSTQKFTNTNNRATYNGVISNNFKVSAVLSANSGNSHVLAAYVAKNGVVLPESFSLTTTNDSSRAESFTTQAVVALTEGDYIEIWIANNSSSTNYVTVTELNVIIDTIT